jgi:hypothetical protein
MARVRSPRPPIPAPVPPEGPATRPRPHPGLSAGGRGDHGHARVLQPTILYPLAPAASWERQRRLRRSSLTPLPHKGATVELSASLKNLAVKGLVTITRTPGGKSEAVDLTRKEQNRAAALTASCE